MLSLACVKTWLRADGSGYVTKAHFPADSQWGYMAYSRLTNYNLWCSAARGMAWQFADTTNSGTFCTSRCWWIDLSDEAL
jgi:fermentation-respiration switch protein FrsA (DUF1100 family)